MGSASRQPGRWRRRLTPWRALAAVLVALSVACGALILTSPHPQGPPAAAGLYGVFTEDVRHAPTAEVLRSVPALVPLREQLEVDAGKLLDAGVVTAVRITRDGAVLVDQSREAPAGNSGVALPPRTVTRDGVRFRLQLSVAQPADLASLRWRRRVLQVLVVVLVALAGAGLWVSRRRYAEQERISLVDPLTGVGNRRQLQRLAARLLRDPAAGRRHVFVLIDLDHFKQLNDRFGHAHGDAALRRLAAVLQETVRPGDHVVRLGGDEFALLLEDVPDPPGDAALVARVLRRVREQLPDLGVSGGGACWPRDAVDLAGLSHTADGAMYADKQRRRTTVDVRTPDAPVR